MNVPLAVSPLIKTARWSALIAGVWWGNKRYQANKETEDAHRAYLAEMTPIWNAEAAAKQAVANREQLIYLAKETGTPIPEGF